MTILLDQEVEALLFTHRTGDHFVAVAIGFLEQTLGTATGLGDDAVGIGFRLQAKPVPVLAGLDGVGEGIDDLRTFEADAFVNALFAEKGTGGASS